MKKRAIIFIFLFVCSIYFVSAQISLSEPYDVYNLGDRLYVSLEGIRGSNEGNLNINLLCENSSINLVKIPSRAFSLDEDSSYSIPYKLLNEQDLEIENFEQILGNCQITVLMGSEVISSKLFTITRDITIEAKTNKVNYDPSEEVNFDILATKANGELVNGFIDVKGVIGFSKAVIDGEVRETLIVPETLEAGSYSLNISVWDDDFNRDSFVLPLKINSVPSFIETSLSSIETLPGEKFTIGEQIFDQSGSEMNGNVEVLVVSSEGEEMLFGISSGETFDLNLAPNSSAGEWRILSSFGEVVNEKTFRVLELQSIETSIEDSILTIKNIGNVEYNKTILINLGDEERELNLKMKVGEVRKFQLSAPDGEHEININDGDDLFQGSVLLTGNAVSVKSFRDVGFFKNYSIIWIFLILILGSTGFILFMRFRKTKKFGVSESPLKRIKDMNVSKTFQKVKSFPSKVHSKLPRGMGDGISNSLNFTKKSPSVQGLNSDEYHHEDKTMKDLTKKRMESAESSLVLKGEKQLSAVICLSIKNYEKLGEDARNKIVSLIEDVKDKKGLIDWKNEYVFFVFSPLATKTYNNELLAAKAGFEAYKSLQEYNRKFRDKILFNIGIHSGELISSKEGGKLKYTSIGNTISFSKRIADSDSGKVLASESIRKKLLRDLRVEKDKEIGKNIVYSISEIRNREANEAKLKDLLHRME